MLVFSSLFFESSESLGGMLTRSITNIAAPVPGSSIVLAPIASRVGESIGRRLPDINDRLPQKVEDSRLIYIAGRDGNISFSIPDQVKAKSLQRKKAKELGYNKLGQSMAIIDPTLISVFPNILTKQKLNGEINNER